MDTKFIINHIGKIRDKAHAFLTNLLDEHDMKGIAPSHGDIIWALLNNDELSMKMLAESIGRDKSTVTALVNKLVRFEYVQKRKDTDDSRVSLISLTEKGRQLKMNFISISEALREKAYEGVSEKEKAELFKLLDKILKNF